MDLHPDFTTNQVMTVAIVTLAVILAIIVFGRFRIRKAASQDFTVKYKDKIWSSPLEARAKYPDVEVFQYSRYGLLFGIVCALALTTTLMNWTVINDVDTGFMDVEYIESEIEVTPPQTSEPPPPPPPPPPPTVIEVPEELFEEVEETVQFMDQSIEAETVVDAPPIEVKAPTVAPPPPPPPPKEDVEEIFKVVEEMPRFPGCEDMQGSSTEKKACADKRLLEFIHANMQYPNYARENNIQGTVVAQFVVNKDGTIQDVSIIRDIGAGCGEEVKRVVAMMNAKNLRWTPGRQRGMPVRVIFILPVKFTLLTS